MVGKFGRTLAGLVVAAMVSHNGSMAAWAQAPTGTTPAGEEVSIKRETLHVSEPAKYKVHLALAPIRSVTLIAPADAVVGTVTLKLGEVCKKEGEAFRLQNTRVGLELKRAAALLTAAKAEKKIASSKNDADLTALADAKVEAAQADKDIAQAVADQLVLRNPLAGEVLRVHVSEGQLVRAGDPLAVIGDVSKLVLEVPVDRSEVKQGGKLSLKAGDTVLTGQVQAVTPCLPRFEVLRDLSDHVGTALVQIDNPDGKLLVGQSVYCDLIPVLPVAPVPVATVINNPDGARRVQVIRNQVVRTVSVKVLGKIGFEQVYVSGPFVSGDEVIISKSKDLADGTSLRPVVAGAAASPATPAGSQPAATKPASGF